MARTNVLAPAPRTHEGAPAIRIDSLAQLRRTVGSCLLWEKEFYEDGEEIRDRIIRLTRAVADNRPADALEVVRFARNELKLRHAPLLMAVALGKYRGVAAAAIDAAVRRADELAEYLAMYWQINGEGSALGAQVKRGLAAAFDKFDEYQFAKYDRDAQVRLRDVLRLVHPKPTSHERSELYKRIATRTLATPDTWEVALSSGADKRETWERLLAENKLGYLAVLRNLRNMEKAGVSDEVVNRAIRERRGARDILPFRFIAALAAAPKYVAALDDAFKATLAGLAPLPGKTGILVDVSGSMDVALSKRSDMTRMDAACGLAAIWPGEKRVWSFSSSLVEVPAFPGLATVQAVKNSQSHSMTALGDAVRLVGTQPLDRLIVITDEQSHDRVVAPAGIERLYMVNVASAKNGVGYGPHWKHIDGFSESVLRWIAEVEG